MRFNTKRRDIHGLRDPYIQMGSFFGNKSACGPEHSNNPGAPKNTLPYTVIPNLSYQYSPPHYLNREDVAWVFMLDCLLYRTLISKFISLDLYRALFVELKASMYATTVPYHLIQMANRKQGWKDTMTLEYRSKHNFSEGN